MVLCLLRASAPGFVIMPLSQSESEKWLRGQKWSRKKITRKNGSLEDASLFTHIIWEKSCKIASITQQGCYIIISKLSYDSSYLSLWPRKVGEEFLNPRTSCSTESSQFPGFLLVKAHRHVFRKVLEEFFKAENEFPASSSPPMGLHQGGPGLQPHNQHSIHTGEIFRWWDNDEMMMVT